MSITMRMLIVFSVFTVVVKLIFVNVLAAKSRAKSKPYLDLTQSRSLFDDFKKRNYPSFYQEREKVFKEYLKANEIPEVKNYQKKIPFGDMDPQEFIKFQDSIRNKPGSFVVGGGPKKKKRKSMTLKGSESNCKSQK